MDNCLFRLGKQLTDDQPGQRWTQDENKNYLSLCQVCVCVFVYLCICLFNLCKVKEGNLERQVIWNSQAKSSISHKLHPLFLVCIVSMKGEFGSSKDG